MEKKMKYIYQIGIIGGISFAAEMLYVFLPLPVPASVYGLLILLGLLMTKVVKVEQIEDVADWLLKIMPILFIAPTVGLVTSFDAIKGQILPLVVMCVVSTVAVMIVTSVTAQFIIRIQNKKQGKKEKSHE